MYIGYIQFFMIGLVFFKSFKDTVIGELVYSYVYISIPILFVLFLLFSLVLGYLDSTLGLKEEEQRNLSQSNPIQMEILASLKRIEKEVEALKSQKEEKV
jgi:hypothetical protein